MKKDELQKFEVLQGYVQEIEIDRLMEADWNPQEMSTKEFGRLVSELREVGFVDPIQVVPLDDGKFRIIGGHQRTAAAKVLGWEKIPAVVVTSEKFKDVDLQKFVTVRLNMLRGKLNPEKMAKLYDEMVEKYGKDALADLMGFTDANALNKITGSVKDSLKKSGLLGDAQKEADVDKKFKEVKTIDDLSMVLNQLFAEYGSTIDQNFMVFVFGKKKHLYIATNKALWDAVETISEWAKVTQTDITKPLAEVLGAYVRDNHLKREIKAARGKPTGTTAKTDTFDETEEDLEPSEPSF